MPWTVKDVDKFKKGLNAAQKKKWVGIANSVLRDCIKNGGKDKTCAPKAIRIANSKFSRGDSKMSKKIKVPVTAFNIVDSGCSAFSKAVELKDGGKEPKLHMVSYSGKIVKNHFWWGDLVIDGKGIKFNQTRNPVLEDHMSSRKIGFSDKVNVGEDGKVTIDPDKAGFVDTEESLEFRRISEQGFPFQASISVRPLVIERLAEGTEAEVNGFTMKGPGTIFRESLYRESSVCVWGYDHRTKSSAFSKEGADEVELELKEIETTVKLQEKKEVTKMAEGTKEKELTYEEFCEQNADMIKKVKEEAVTETTSSFSTQLAELKKQNEKVMTVLGEVQKENKNIQKTNVLLKEDTAKAKANEIWIAKLSDTSVPPHLFDKVKGMKSYSDFMDENNNLKVSEFTEAVDAEIKSWEDLGLKSEAPVKGTGTTGRDTESSEAKEEARLSKEDEEDAEDMLRLAGISVKKEE